MATGFSAAEQALIRDSFRMLAADLPSATSCFYAHLFRRAPDTRALFVTDLDRQGRKLGQTLETVVGLLDRWGLLRTQLGDLAIRHLAYGVRAEHYPPVEEALLLMLAERLGPGFSAAHAAAWRRLLRLVGEAMVEAAYPPAEPAADEVG